MNAQDAIDATVGTVKWDEAGLCVAVAQDRLTGRVQMVAWMNADALAQTLRTGIATFWSRSRKKLWVKGETSGNGLAVDRVAIDCDGDTILLMVEPAGPSCHTGEETCFFHDKPAPTSTRDTTPAESFPRATPIAPLLVELEAQIDSRRSSTAEKSYTRSLFDGGAPKIGDKIREEAEELSRAIAGESDERVANEAADVLFHMMVGLRHRGVSMRQVLAVLAARRGRSGHAEKAARAPKS